jgi:hypothetical protein
MTIQKKQSDSFHFHTLLFYKFQPKYTSIFNFQSGYTRADDFMFFGLVRQPTGTRCLEGLYCAGGSAAPALCSAAPGYYCPEGSSSPVGIQCDAGYYCIGGSTGKIPCRAAQGKYCSGGSSASDGNSQCPAGWYCAGQALPQVDSSHDCFLLNSSLFVLLNLIFYW